ncbi:hypothetical protein [Mycobacterium asiaticum]|uniref:hypothetical protein n=1 Tax=Mycobacterium asiaticum TaxID=1790 RepID=UPI000AA41FBA|nr:hypothetical protein [Mycobacterium asiaticum]
MDRQAHAGTAASRIPDAFLRHHVLSFLDQLGWMISLEGIQGLEELQKLDVFTV